MATSRDVRHGFNDEVFIISTSGSLYEQTEAANGSGYSTNGRHPLGNGASSIATTFSAGNGASEVFVVTTSGGLYVQTENSGGGYSATGWFNLGSSSKSVAAGHDGHGNAEVFVATTNGNLYEQTERANGSGYLVNGFRLIGTSISRVATGNDVHSNDEVWVVTTSGSLELQVEIGSNDYGQFAWQTLASAIHACSSVAFA
jgi:hypothetical protein